MGGWESWVSGVFVCWTIPLQDDKPVYYDCLVVNGTSTFIINIPLRPVLSTCPLHTNSECGKERRILIGPW